MWISSTHDVCIATGQWLTLWRTSFCFPFFTLWEKEKLVTMHPFPISHQFVSLMHTFLHVHFFSARAPSCLAVPQTLLHVHYLSLSTTSKLFQFCYSPFGIGQHYHDKTQTTHGFIQKYKDIFTLHFIPLCSHVSSQYLLRLWSNVSTDPHITSPQLHSWGPMSAQWLVFFLHVIIFLFQIHFYIH